MLQWTVCNKSNTLYVYHTQDQITGFIWCEIYLKLLEQPGFKGAQECTNRLISRVSSFNSPLSEFYTYFHTF